MGGVDVDKIAVQLYSSGQFCMRAEIFSREEKEALFSSSLERREEETSEGWFHMKCFHGRLSFKYNMSVQVD